MTKVATGRRGACAFFPFAEAGDELWEGEKRISGGSDGVNLSGTSKKSIHKIVSVGGRIALESVGMRWTGGGPVKVRG